MSSFKWSDYTILIAEDDIDMLDIFKDLFLEQGANVLTAVNGSEALKISHSTKIDFVLSDVQMPIMSGFDFLKNLRQTYPDLPAVLLATGHSELTREIAIENGAQDLIHKPFDSEALLKMIKDILQKIKK